MATSTARAPSAAELCAELRVDARTGLSEAEAATRLGAAGPNRIRTGPSPSRLALVARQFANSMVLLLVGAAAISLSIGELLDATVILAIVVANALFGAVQEGRTSQPSAGLRHRTARYRSVAADQAVPTRRLGSRRATPLGAPADASPRRVARGRSGRSASRLGAAPPPAPGQRGLVAGSSRAGQHRGSKRRSRGSWGSRASDPPGFLQGGLCAVVAPPSLPRRRSAVKVADPTVR